MHRNLWLTVFKSGDLDRDGQNLYLRNIYEYGNRQSINGAARTKIFTGEKLGSKTDRNTSYGG